MAAEAALNASDRDAGGTRLRRAGALAHELGARRLGVTSRGEAAATAHRLRLFTG